MLNIKKILILGIFAAFLVQNTYSMDTSLVAVFPTETMHGNFTRIDNLKNITVLRGNLEDIIKPIQSSGISITTSTLTSYLKNPVILLIATETATSLTKIFLIPECEHIKHVLEPIFTYNKINKLTSLALQGIGYGASESFNQANLNTSNASLFTKGAIAITFLACPYCASNMMPKIALNIAQGFGLSQAIGVTKNLTSKFSLLKSKNNNNSLYYIGSAIAGGVTIYLFYDFINISLLTSLAPAVVTAVQESVTYDYAAKASKGFFDHAYDKSKQIYQFLKTKTLRSISILSILKKNQ